MRYIIYGAGGIGCIIGGHLFRTGHEVVLIGRAGNVRAIRERGLHLITPTGTYDLRVPAVTELQEMDFRPDDAVFLTMKGQNTADAMKRLKEETQDVPVFCFQNGVRNEEIASGCFPRVYGIMVWLGAVYVKDGEVIARRDPPGWFVIGRYPKGSDETVERVAADLRTAGFHVKPSEDVMPYKWGKLMDNLSNSIGAITDAGLKETGAITDAARKEMTELLAEAGIRWVSRQETEKEWPEITGPLNGSLDTRERSSTWQSLARQQGSVETEFFNGEVVRLAARLGRKAPINETLLRITLEMAEKKELPGKYTVEQLTEILETAEQE